MTVPEGAANPHPAYSPKFALALANGVLTRSSRSLKLAPAHPFESSAELPAVLKLKASGAPAADPMSHCLDVQVPACATGAHAACRASAPARAIAMVMSFLAVCDWCTGRSPPGTGGQVGLRAELLGGFRPARRGRAAARARARRGTSHRVELRRRRRLGRRGGFGLRDRSRGGLGSIRFGVASAVLRLGCGVVTYLLRGRRVTYVLPGASLVVGTHVGCRPLVIASQQRRARHDPGGDARGGGGSTGETSGDDLRRRAERSELSQDPRAGAARATARTARDKLTHGGVLRIGDPPAQDSIARLAGDCAHPLDDRKRIHVDYPH